MAIKLKKWHKFVLEILVLIVIGALWIFVWCPSCLATWENQIVSMALSATIWITLSKGNGYVSDLVGEKISWLEQPVKRFVVTLGAMSTFTVVAVLSIVKIYGSFGVTIKNTDYTIIISVIITIAIASFFTAKKFLQNWRRLELNTAKLKNESLSSKFESLKSQVNPHFLFNSLNVLSALVYKDQDEAVKFIKRLSNVYRYVLDQKDKEVVDIQTELEFVKSYIFLQKIRHGDSLQVNVDIPDNTEAKVAPLSLQMLVENAVKHNIISRDEPLNIDIRLEEGQYIVVENNLQKKNTIS